MALLPVRFVMKPSGVVLFAALLLCAVIARAANATSPVDYAERNGLYAPAPSAAPSKRTPETNDRLQEKRVDKSVVEKQPAAVGDRRAPIDMKETREKTVRDKNSHRPETVEHTTSAFNHRPAAISTESDTRKPPLVSRYQDSLTAASATNMARFPALDRTATAKINRFVFRKNPSEPSPVVNGSPVVPAAGGSVLQK
jgi:hypothetical protein